MRQRASSRASGFVAARVVFVVATHSSLCGCTASLLSKDDYRQSLHAYYRQSPRRALDDFPDGERGEFITTMEKSLLGLMNGTVDLKPLRHFADVLEGRPRFTLSRELRFTLLQTPEGYYASEHEIIWMHILLGWGYCSRGRPGDGMVEARRSANLLENPWSYEGAFDDPALRVMLAGLYALCGSWQEAQVDLRRAHRLDPSLDWALELSERPAPAHLTVVLGGVGPVPRWAPELQPNLPRAARAVQLQSQARRRARVLVDALGQEQLLHLSPSSKPWYDRHLLRDQELHDLIADTRYGTKAVASSAAVAGEVAASVVLGAVLTVASIVTGLGILYLGVEGESEEVAKLGLAITLGGSAWSIGTTWSSIKDATARLGNRLDPSRHYRFVRYLPEYIAMAWGEGPVQEPLQIYDDKRQLLSGTRVPGPPQHPVTILHAPDVDRDSADPWIWRRADEWLDEFVRACNNASLREATREALARTDGDSITVRFESDGLKLRANLEEETWKVIEPRGFFSSNNTFIVDANGARFSSSKSERAFLSTSAANIAEALLTAVLALADQGSE